MNPTILKFGWPETQIAELDHWAVMVRPQQPVLGALVLTCKQPVTSFGDVDAGGHEELGRVIKSIENMLKATVQYEKINYLMLMMADLDVHFHVLPRYEGTRRYKDIDVADAGWPGQPDLGQVTQLTIDQQLQMAQYLRQHWSI